MSDFFAIFRDTPTYVLCSIYYLIMSYFLFSLTYLLTYQKIGHPLWTFPLHIYIIYITLHVVMSKITSLWKMQFLKDIVTKLFKNASKALRKIDIKCYRENDKHYETISKSSVKPSSLKLVYLVHSKIIHLNFLLMVTSQSPKIVVNFCKISFSLKFPDFR